MVLRTIRQRRREREAVGVEGWGMGPLPIRLGDLEEHREIHQQGLGRRFNTFML